MTDIRKITAIFLLICHIGAFSITTTTNALLDAQNAEENNRTYNQVEQMNRQANDDPVLFNIGSIMSTAAAGSALYGLENKLSGSIKGVGSSSGLSSGNDTNSSPSTWNKTKLKPWQIILVVIFMARELRELKKGGGGNGSINNPNYESSPIGKIKNSNDIRGQIIVNMFKITGNITDNVGRTLSNVLAVFLLLMGTLEILIGILKGVTDSGTEEPKSILIILKDMFPQLMVMGTLLLLLANSFFWNFYTGPLFNISVKIGSMLSGQKFDMYNLPDYIGKLFNAPFAIIASGAAMMFSAKNVTNSILPTVILFSGLILLWFCLKAAIEILTVLVDYLIIGCFTMVVMLFMALRITKNMGSGGINAISGAMVNVIVMFTLIGFAFSNIDKLNVKIGLDINKLLNTIITIFIINALLSQIKTIGSFLNSGSAAFIPGSKMIDDVTGAITKMTTAGNFIKNFTQSGGSLTTALSETMGKPFGGSDEGKKMRDIRTAANKNVRNAKNSNSSSGSGKDKSSIKVGGGTVNGKNNGNKQGKKKYTAEQIGKFLKGESTPGAWEADMPNSGPFVALFEKMFPERARKIDEDGAEYEAKKQQKYMRQPEPDTVEENDEG